MSFVAEAELALDGADRAAAFARLRDFRTWKAWMPRSFVPVSGPDRPFEIGDRFRVRIAHAPNATPLEVCEIEDGTAIAWKGGVPGLRAVHRFVFEPKTVRSIETWSGALSVAVRPVVRPLASRIALQQLAGLLGTRRP